MLVLLIVGGVNKLLINNVLTGASLAFDANKFEFNKPLCVSGRDVSSLKYQGEVGTILLVSISREGFYNPQQGRYEAMYVGSPLRSIQYRRVSHILVVNGAFTLRSADSTPLGSGTWVSLQRMNVPENTLDEAVGLFMRIA